MTTREWGKSSKRPVPLGTYLVRPGDNLWKIARRTYGNPNWWYEVFQANRRLLSFCEVVHPGMTIRLPALT